MRHWLPVLGLILAGCAQEPPTSVDFKTIVNPKLDGHRVTLEGYAGLPRQVFSGKGQILLFRDPSMDHFAASNSTTPDTAFVYDIPEGTGANQMEKLPSDFGKADLKVHTAGGQVVGYGKKLKVTGTLSHYQHGAEFDTWDLRPPYVFE